MSIQRSLRGNFAWTLLGNVVYAACQWGIIIMLTKLGNTESVGEYALALALTAPIFMFSNLQLRAIQATDAVGRYTFSDYLGLRLITIIVSLTIILIITALSSSHYTITTISIIILIGLSKAIESLSDIIFGLLQQRERMDLIARSMLLKGIISLGLLTGLLLLTGNSVISIAGVCIAWLIVLIAVDFKNGRQLTNFTVRMNLPTLWSLIQLSLPLGIVMMLISLNDAIPRYVIEYYMNLEELGYYASIFYIAAAGSTIVGALGQSASPRLAKYYSAHRINEVKQLTMRLLLLGLGIGFAGIVVVMLFGRELLVLIYQPEYAAYYDLLLLIMICATITYMSSLLGFGMTAARMFKVQPYLFALMTVINLISQLILVPLYGLHGAIYSLMITGGVQLVTSFAVNVYAWNRIKQSEGDPVVSTTA
jgi:O-antigen/teichoic acid export membrane protein